MLLCGAVAKIEAKYIDASSDELGDGVVRITGGSDGGDDFSRLMTFGFTLVSVVGASTQIPRG